MAKTTTKAAKKGSTKKYKPPAYGVHTLYAVPINEAAASGDLRQMKSMATKARKHIAEVQAALAKLEKAMGHEVGNG